MILRPFQLNDRIWIERCRDPKQNPFSALSFPSLFAWSKTYGLTIAANEGAFAIHSVHDKAFYCPCGSEDACTALVRQIEQTEEHPHIIYLTYEQAERFERDGWKIHLRDDLSEYLASTSALALRSGHASNSYKMKCRHFQQKFTYNAWMLGDADLPELKALAAGQLVDDRENKIGDLDVLNTELDMFHILSLEGLMIRTTEGKEAFILGFENSPGMFTMTMAKHDPSLPRETTAVLVHELSKRMDDRYPQINLEEDLGIKGLRQAKMLYSPLSQLKVYVAEK